VREEYSCTMWKGEEEEEKKGSNTTTPALREKGEEERGNATILLRQTFILTEECVKTAYWAAFIKHRPVKLMSSPAFDTA
jgi:hypothetical protein